MVTDWKNDDQIILNGINSTEKHVMLHSNDTTYYASTETGLIGCTSSQILGSSFSLFAKLYELGWSICESHVGWVRIGPVTHVKGERA